MGEKKFLFCLKNPIVHFRFPVYSISEVNEYDTEQDA